MGTSILQDIEHTLGRCAFCDDPLPPPRTKPASVCCGGAECKRAYNNAYARHRLGPHRLQRVVNLYGQSDGWFQELACGHRVTAHRWIQRRKAKRRCPTCYRVP